VAIGEEPAQQASHSLHLELVRLGLPEYAELRKSGHTDCFSHSVKGEQRRRRLLKLVLLKIAAGWGPETTFHSFRQHSRDQAAAG
jgi:hypothetical protein